MMKNLAILSIALVSLLTTISCSFNDVDKITNFELPSQNRAIIVFGLGVKGELRESSQRINLQFHEYNLEKQESTQICFFRYNHADAYIDNKPNEFRYFVFDVAPGYYALGGGYAYHIFEKTPLAKAAKGPAYEVSAGKIVYLGDFIYSNRDEVSPDKKNTVAYFESQRPKITVTNNSEKATAFINSLFPKFNGELSIPEPKMVKPPEMILCAP
jgi:hypothetical protein